MDFSNFTISKLVGSDFYRLSVDVRFHPDDLAQQDVMDSEPWPRARLIARALHSFASWYEGGAG